MIILKPFGFMVKKKRLSRQKSAQAPLKAHYSVLFCLNSPGPEELKFMNDSLKRFSSDHSQETSFFVYCREGNIPPDTEILPDPSLKFLASDKPLEEILVNKPDYLFVLNVENPEQSMNLNDLFRGAYPFPPPEGYSRIFFENQSEGEASMMVIGKVLLEYLIEPVFRKDTGLMENISWYLRRLYLRDRKIILRQEFPFGKPKRKKHPFSPRETFKRWTDWNFSFAFREYRNRKRSAVLKSSSLLRPAFLLAVLATLVVLPLISYRAGISGDEEKHYLHAEKVYNYFATEGRDTSALTDPKYKLNYYGQSFDLLSFVIIKTFHIEKIYETRHVINGLAGAALIIVMALLVRLLAGNFAGLLTIFLLFFSPRFLGHAMNNPLDIPFALGYAFTCLQIIRFLKRLPRFSGLIGLWITLGIAFTISIRIGGLILIPYLFLFSGLFLLFKKWPWKFMSEKYLKFAGKGILYLIVISVTSYFLSILPWPYALQDPLKNPFQSLAMMANISVALRVMFEGNIIWSDNLPWYYLPKNIILTVPLLILVFFLAPLLFARQKRNETDPFWIFFLYFISIFPILYIIFKESNVYGGWRHLLFIYPGMVALAAIRNQLAQIIP